MRPRGAAYGTYFFLQTKRSKQEKKNRKAKSTRNNPHCKKERENADAFSSGCRAGRPCRGRLRAAQALKKESGCACGLRVRKPSKKNPFAHVASGCVSPQKNYAKTRVPIREPAGACPDALPRIRRIVGQVRPVRPRRDFTGTLRRLLPRRPGGRKRGWRR